MPPKQKKRRLDEIINSPAKRISVRVLETIPTKGHILTRIKLRTIYLSDITSKSICANLNKV